MKIMKTFNKALLLLSILLMSFGGVFYYYENNPQVYNTLADAGVDLGILDSLGKWEGELPAGEYYSLVDKDNQEIEQTGHEVFIGDEWIADDNTRYKVVKVDINKKKAICEKVGKETLTYMDEWDEEPVFDGAAKKQIGVYATHTDESYVPTDGTESRPGRGGILSVAATLVNKLKEQGVRTEISYNKHDPHDANAYHRSRKTAVQLLKNNPSVLIDVHRDGVPDPNFYKTNISGQTATKIRLVVGRQNPHMSANLEFAKQVKAYFDKNNPGFIKGIFLAKGNYNQDLGPRVMLIEVGTHTNSRQAAERGVSQFAQGLPKIIGAAAGGPPGGVTPGAGTGSSIFWIILVVLVGGGAFLLLSTGSIQGSLDKLSNLGKEFSNYLGPISSKRKKRNNPDEENK